MSNEKLEFEEKYGISSINERTKKRPLGITILAILNVIGALLSFVIIFAIPDYYLSFQLISAEIYLGIILITVVVSFIQLIVAYGLLKGISWAWTAEFALVIINGVLSGLVAFIFAIIIIFYLTRPHVKDYFDK